jgi:hypothetical protein
MAFHSCATARQYIGDCEDAWKLITISRTKGLVPIEHIRRIGRLVTWKFIETAVLFGVVGAIAAVTGTYGWMSILWPAPIEMPAMVQWASLAAIFGAGIGSGSMYIYYLRYVKE